MDRRKFLRIIAGAAPILAVPTYFFAPLGGWPSSIPRVYGERRITRVLEYFAGGDFDFSETTSARIIAAAQDYYRIEWEKYPKFDLTRGSLDA